MKKIAFLLIIILIFTSFVPTTFALEKTYADLTVRTTNFCLIPTDQYNLSNSVCANVYNTLNYNITDIPEVFVGYDEALSKLQYFGNPDSDMDGKITYLFWDGIKANGVYNYFHQSPVYDNRDVIELNIDYIQNGGLFGPRDALGIIMHELQHAIHYQNDPNEAVYINEGCSEYVRYDITGDSTRLREFVNVNYDFYKQNYAKDFLYMVYLADKNGGKNFIKQIIQNKGTGHEAVAAMLNTTPAELFEDFTISSKIDKGNYDITSFDLWQQYTTIPLTEFNNVNGEVKGWNTQWKNIQPNSKSIKIQPTSSTNMKFAITTLDVEIGTKPGFTGKYILNVGNNPVVNTIYSGDIIEECIIEELDQKEKYWIEYYESNNHSNGYNMTDGGSNGVLNKEARQKISKALKGKKLSEEHKQKIKENNAMKNNPEVRKKSAQSRIGLPGTMLGKEAWNKGKTGIYSEETLKKMSEIKKGKTYSKETREKISKAKSGPNGWNWKEPTQEMIDDVKNGMKRNDFYRKYNLSKSFWLKIKNLYLKEG